MELKCLSCGNKFDGSISKDWLGWHSTCPECGCSFDVDVPDGKFVMAFTDPIDDAEDPYCTFKDDFTGENVNFYFAFDTAEAFMNKWRKIVYCEDGPYGMWYWVLYNGKQICSGACDPYDEEIFKEHFSEWCNDEKTFTLKELENAFEMGRTIQNMIQDGVIDVGSKEAFNFAIPLVTEFEQICSSSDYYYEDIDRFTVHKFMNAFAEEE